MDSYKVLFVDDEEDLLNCLRRALREEAFQCLFATSAAEALEVLARESVDVIVADIRMPVKSGIQLLEDVQAEYPEVIRILLSGDPSIEPDDISCLVQAVHKGSLFKFIAKSVELDVSIRNVLQEAFAQLASQSINKA